MAKSLLERAVAHAGPEAVLELAKQYRIDPDHLPWEIVARPEQQLPAGDDWLTWLVCAGRGFGKALALDTDLPTPGGWTTMGDVQVGDHLIDEMGRPCSVTYTTEVQLGRPCFDVVFDDGTVIVADADHQWLTKTHAVRKAEARRVPGADDGGRPQCRRRLKPGLVTTKDIQETLLYCGRERNHSIDVCKPLDFPEAQLPVDPYTLGVWLGDGDSAGPVITTADPEILESLRGVGYAVDERPSTRCGRASRFQIGSKPLRRDPTTGRMLPNGSLCSALRELGVIKNKHIPGAYLRSAEPQRRALLQGLMDTDGHVTPNGHCELTGTNRRLMDDSLELCRSLGIKATMSEGRAVFEGRDCGPKYRVKFTAHTPVFRLGRKLARQHSGKRQAARISRRYITEVRTRATVPVRCIQVDSPSHLFLASRSFVPTHNTRTGAESVIQWAKQGEYRRIALVAPTAGDVRDIIVEGESGILACSPPDFRPNYEPSKRRLTWPNGVTGHTYSADEPDRLRGPQHHGCWADEAASWKLTGSSTQQGSAMDMLMFGLRLGRRPRRVITTTPRPLQWIRDLVKDPTCVVTTGSTYDNRSNLAAPFFQQIVSAYEGTRLGRQELNAEILEDVEGALWSWAMIDDNRRADVPDIQRLVVGVDPAATNTENSDETGIAAVAQGTDGDFYVLADLSAKDSPAGWGRRAVEALRDRGGDRIVGEVNNGGDMVEHVVRSVDPYVPFRAVRATRGKAKRAEPVAALYEQGRVHHVGIFAELEDQMVTFDPAAKGQASPDRMDALVWAITDLVESSGVPCVIT